MSVNNVEEVLEAELKISEEEAKLFLLIIHNGRMDTKKISQLLNWSVNEADEVAKSLISRGMVIDITKTEYESLHPRFAVTNRYRRRCEEDNIPFKKNLKVDKIGFILERPYNDARRTK
ncbi:MAG TPA: helix-turn-helix domain-containing protein [Nitrososphaeraceae archaeon]|nr:helix-turn-helix domain-containing protein [Nitrososphaeraceae archaeon]